MILYYFSDEMQELNIAFLLVRTFERRFHMFVCPEKYTYFHVLSVSFRYVKEIEL
jgi:hypothetical protein